MLTLNLSIKFHYNLVKVVKIISVFGQSGGWVGANITHWLWSILITVKDYCKVIWINSFKFIFKNIVVKFFFFFPSVRVNRNIQSMH